MSKRLGALLLAALAPLAWASSCSSPPELPVDPSGTGGGFVGDAGDHDAAGGDGGAPPIGDGGPPAQVWAALAAPPADGDPDGPGAYQAELAAFSLGARGVVLEASFRDLCDADGAVDPVAVGALAARAQAHVDAGRRVHLELAAARRGLDLRPTALASLAWDDAAVVGAWVAVAEAVLDAAPGVWCVGAGVAVDATLADAPPFVTFALDARAELASLPAPPRLSLGLLAGGLIAGTAPDQPQSPALMLANAFDVVRVTYLPEVDGAPASPLDLVDALLAALPDRTFLLEAGAAPSSPDDQALFHARLRTTITSHRDRFPFVRFVQARDVEGEGCVAYAGLQGLDPSSDAASALCATGVLGVDGAPKPALAELLTSLATLAAP